MGKAGSGAMRKGVAAMVAASVLLVPAIAVAAVSKARPAAVALSFDRISAFTPAGADPRLAAAFALRNPSVSDFRFTPAAAKGRASQIRVAVRAGGGSTPIAGIRTVQVANAGPVSALTPTSYNLGVAVGWKRFAVSGDLAKTDSVDSAFGKRESAVLGVSYNLKKFSGRLAVAADRGDGRVPALVQPDHYMVDVGGAYSLSRRVAVTGGVRYRVDEDRLRLNSDPRRDSQAVYVGTAFKF